MNRIEKVREVVDEILLNMSDQEERRCDAACFIQSVVWCKTTRADTLWFNKKRVWSRYVKYDCGFEKGNYWFRYRAGGILIHDNKIADRGN